MGVGRFRLQAFVFNNIPDYALHEWHNREHGAHGLRVSAAQNLVKSRSYFW